MLAYICDRCKKLLSDYDTERGNSKFKISKSSGVGTWETVSLCADCEDLFSAWLDNTNAKTRAATITEQVETKGYYVPLDMIDTEPDDEPEPETAEEEAENKTEPEEVQPVDGATEK